MRRRCVKILIVIALFGTAASPAAAHDRSPSERRGHDGATAQRNAIDRYVIPGGAVFPEGIASGRGGTFFVGSLGDGTVYRGDIDEPELEVFLPGGVDGRTSIGGIEVDDSGRLWLAGGTSGLVWVYDTDNGELLQAFSNGRAAEGTLLNDLTVTRDGVYITDSWRPELWYIPLDHDGFGEMSVFLDWTGTDFSFSPGELNANGIAASRSGDTLIVGQYNAGRLFRVDTDSREVDAIDLGKDALPGPDGLSLGGRGRLSVVQNGPDLAQVSTVRLDRNFRTGRVVETVTDYRFNSPTTLAEVDGDYLVVNSQITALFSGQPPVLPFDIVRIDGDRHGQRSR